MNRKEKIVLSPTVLPIDIKSELDKFNNLCDSITMHLEESKKSGKLLEKNREVSNRARKAGNALYIKKGHDTQTHCKILKLYSKSIAFASNGTEELALGYSNRSSLLMHLHRYKESLVDIKKALQLTKDDMFKTKLQAHKEKCLKLINDIDMKKSTYNSTFINNQNLEQLASNLINFKPSAAMPCASDCVSLVYNESFGRHLVATRDIEPGEILIVEEGQAWYPVLSQIHLVCSHCLQIAWNGIPCDQCVFVIYCSDNCKTEALNEYHDIECTLVKYLEFTIFSCDKYVHDRLATMRLLIKFIKKEGHDFIMNEIFNQENKGSLDSILSDGILQSDKFKACYNLLHHAEKSENKNDKEDFCTSVMVFLLLEHTDLFHTRAENAMTETGVGPHIMLKIKEVLTNLKDIIVVNGFSFKTTIWQCGCNNILKCQKRCDSYKGVFLSPCCSLLNHSCTFNTSYMFAPKRKIIVFSTSPIKKGEQLCISYGVSVVNSDLKIRENRLKHFRFTCKCQACVDAVDGSKVPDICDIDAVNISKELKNTFPNAKQNLLLEKSHENWDMSEEKLHCVTTLSQLYYKHFNYYEAFVHNDRCLGYIQKMMSELYEEKSAIPNNC